MRPRDWFEVGARLIGLWIMTLAIEDAREVVLIRLGFFSPLSTPIVSYVSRLAMHAIVGTGLVVAAGLLTDLLFGAVPPPFEVKTKRKAADL